VVAARGPARDAVPTTLGGMRTMFLVWSGIIVAGVVFFSIIGLIHH
jgi:hypothetical protein